MTYRMMKPKDPGNIQKLSEGHAPAWREITPEQFFSTVTIDTENGPETYDFAYLALDTSVTLKNARNPQTPQEAASPQSIWVWASKDIWEASGVTEDSEYDVHGFVQYNEEAGYCVWVYTKDGILPHND
jgi:hypothetical protein